MDLENKNCPNLRPLTPFTRESNGMDNSELRVVQVWENKSKNRPVQKLSLNLKGNATEFLYDVWWPVLLQMSVNSSSNLSH